MDRVLLSTGKDDRAPPTDLFAMLNKEFRVALGAGSSPPCGRLRNRVLQKGLMQMRVLSLFDGISCGRVAFDRAGIPVDEYHAYEVAASAIQISRNNWPDIVHKGDVTSADFSQYRDFDILIGGSPCQSLSIVQSKTRQNLDGKSRLFFDFVRAKDEMHPKWFLFENVASMNQECKAVISELLGCSPVFIDSGNFCAQERPRLYWTNIPVDLSTLPTSVATLSDVLLPAEEVPAKYWYDLPLSEVNMAKQVCATLQFKNHDIHKRVFSPAYKCHTLTCVSGGHQQKKVLQNGRVRKLTPLEYERLQTLPDNYTAGVADDHRYTACGNGWTVDVIAWILSFIPKIAGAEEWML